MSDLKQALLSLPGVFDAHVLDRTAADGRARRVAYVVPAGSFSAAATLRALAGRFPGERAPDDIVTLPRLPVDADGHIDVDQLARVPVVDGAVCDAWEQLLAGHPNITRVAALPAAPQRDEGRLHLDDLLPQRARATDDDGRDDEPEGPPWARAGAMAIADGGPLPALPPDAPTVLGDALLRAARGDGGVITVDNAGHTRHESYAALAEHALRLLAVLQQRGLTPGARVILQLRDPVLHFRAFWACVLGGVIPVTVAIPSDYDAQQAVVRKLVNVWHLLERPVVLTEAALADGVARVLEPGAPIMLVGDTQAGAHGVVHRARPGDVVFHQLTSGSTGTPKCIQETHAGIIAHIHASALANGYHAGDVTLNWLPFDHVVPTLTVHLKDVYLGSRQIHVHPDRVLAEPLRWLDLLQQHRVTRTWAPNFAFKMIADAVRRGTAGPWDLSSVRTWMNAGEMVTLPALRDFLAALAPSGVTPAAIQPAFGMAEACTCMTYNNAFDLDRSSLRARVTRGGELRRCGDDPRAAVFIDLGPPTAGVAIRITDERNTLVPEGQVGRFQIKGQVITPGYLLNDSANAEAFVGDGWFNTGDRGFILDGRLYLTGREKEVIIVRGANFYAYEIEDAVERVEGVAPTWAAACSWADPDSATEGLAIFFVARTAHDEATVARRVRGQVAAAFGISPSIVLPISQEEFPKTTSGKIQRTQLKARLRGEGLVAARRRSERLFGGEQSLPDWFFRPQWQPLAAHATGPAPTRLLVLTEETGRADGLANALAVRTTVLQASRGPRFERLAADRYTVPADLAGYHQLLADAAPDAIAVLWPFEHDAAAEPLHASLLPLMQAIAAHDRPPRLLLVTRGAAAITEGDAIFTDRAAARALARVAAEETPGLECRHLDLQAADPAWADRCAAELLDAGHERVVAYRDGRRLVPRLTRHRPRPRRDAPLTRGGAYLVSGGLGGLGRELVRHLATQWDAHVLVIGRAPAVERAGALGELAALGAKVSYAQVDVTRRDLVDAAVRAFEGRTGESLAGVFHLAGVYQPRLLRDESPESFAAALRAKVDGAEALAGLLDARPNCTFCAFSSINGYFGGMMVSAYTASNLILESLVERLRRAGRRAVALAWSIWDDLGMNAGNPTRERLADLGYRAIAPTDGLNAMLACLADDGAAVTLIGLDAGRAHVARELVDDATPAPIVACFESQVDVFPLASMRALTVVDAFGTPAPASFRHLPALPLSAEGAVDRAALARTLLGQRVAPAGQPATDLQRRLRDIFREVLGVERVGVHDNFFDLGGSSLLMARVQARIKEVLGHEVDGVEMFRFPTVAALAERLARADAPARSARAGEARRGHEPIAVVAMTCRFPKARSVDEYWDNLVHGRECIRRLDDAELRESGVSPELLQDPRYVRAAGVLDDIDQFAASFFGCTAGEAEAMDPQHRVFMELAWEALESAGYDPRRYPGAIGVFAGTTLNSYSLGHAPKPELEMAFFSDLVASDREFIATRLAYKLDLRGPAVNVQTACSTGLVAIHMACQSLLAGDSDMALAGAASIRVPQRSGYLYQEGGIFSPDGHCRTFDADASGTVFGNGAGVVLLKPLADAVRDGDTVLAVIRATAINNDGSLKAGFTAPCQDGQIEVIRQALARAELRPADIDYVEAHGTGTSMGDPIEVSALAEVFTTEDARPGACLLGSVKPSIGHLDAAAGMAGFIKTVLMLSRGRVVPTLHYQRPNPKLQLERTPFRVATTSEPWAAADRPLRAGVSAFGIGGTNAHAIVEQAPRARETAVDAPCDQVLLLSAQSEAALKAMSHQLADALDADPAIDLADVAYTLQVGRARFDHRRVVVAGDSARAAAALRAEATGELALRASGAVLLFPGQGAQFPGMAADHYRQIPAFAEELDALLALPETPAELRDLLLEPGDQPGRAERFARTDLAQPGVFAVSLAMARVLRDRWGVSPVALAGHSLGEYVAATLAGVFSAQDAMRLIVARGRLMQAAPTGAMLSVQLPARALVELLGECEVAAINAPEQTVVSGTEEAIAALEARLSARDIACRRLRTSHAYHSRLMDDVQARLRAEFAGITLRAPTLPFVSCLTGAWISPTQATDPDYWVAQMRHTVLFADAAKTLLSAGHSVFLEVGPGAHLTALMRRQPGFDRAQRAWASHPHTTDGRAPTSSLLEALGRLDGCGAGPDWTSVHAAPRRRVPLPTYPFERRRYWRDPSPVASAAQPTTNNAAIRRPDPQDWFYRDAWRREPTRAPARRKRGSQPAAPPAGRWLVFAAGESYEHGLLARLDAPYVVFPGPAFRRIDDTRFEVSPDSAADHATLLAALRDAPPDRIVHLWGLADGAGLREGLHATLHLIQALVAEGDESPVRIGVVSAETEQVLGDERLAPEKVAVLGLCNSVGADYPHLGCFHADVLRGELAHDRDPAWVELLLRDMIDADVTGARAYRGGYCWTRGLAAVDPRREVQAEPRLRDGGVYLVTGGLGGIGLAIAEWLGRTHRARLALVSRTALPAPEQWADLAQTDGRLARALSRLVALRDAGVDILHCQADVTDRAAMAAAVAEVTRRFGALHGVVHAANASTHGSFRMIGQTDAGDWARELAPKLHGTRVLGEVLPDDLDFCLVSGSVATVLGDRGGAVEAAANLAAAAVARNAATAYPWIVVDWERWSFHRHGLAEGSTGDVLFNLDLTMQGKFNMTPDEGLFALERALGLAEPGRVVLSCADVDARTREQRADAAALKVPMPVGKKTTGLTAGARHERPALSTAYAPPTDPLAGALCEQWAELLGLERVGVDDNFFDLGGDSLLFLKFAARLRSVHAAPVGQLFAAPTVGQIAALLRAAGVEQLTGDAPAAAPAAATSAPVVQSIREHQFVVGPNAGAEEKKAQMQRVYNAVTQQLNAHEFASHAIFLNYGYRENHLPQRARLALPARLLNRNCIKLVLELFGECPFDETTRFLDIGCGRGGTISVLNTYFGAGEVVGLDLSPEAVAFNQRTHTWPNTRFVQGDAERLPFADGAFDVVTNVESSHSYPDLRAFYREVYRVLAPGGRFLYTDIFPTAMVAECVDALCRLGFTLRDDRDITTNVVASCDEIGAAHFHAFTDGNDAEALGNFLGSPGSKVYNDMQRGYSTYRIFEFVK